MVLELRTLLTEMVARDASDFYLTLNAPPSVKVNGRMESIADYLVCSEDLFALVKKVLSPDAFAELIESREMNLAWVEEGVGRFRFNIFYQRNELALVIRAIKTALPSLANLGLPEKLRDLIMLKRGLILFVGGTGSGKSTSLAALINHRNESSSDHIISIEDPIEFIHPHKKSLVNQREVGVDTSSYEAALKNTLRQAPDVILIGEIRSQDIMEHALTFAETGHLCLSTLHANNANQAIERIIHFFPEERHNQIYLDLSLNMRAIVSQRLVPTLDGGRTAAIEILLGTPLARDLIKRRDILGLKELMEKSEEQGMQTFDSALFKLWEEGRISEEYALKNADSENNVKLRISLSKGQNGGGDPSRLSIKYEADLDGPKALDEA